MAGVSPTLTEEQFREAVEKSTMGMCLITTDGMVPRANRAFTDILGYDPEDDQEVRIQAIAHQEDMDQYKASQHALLSGEEEEASVEMRFFHKKGHRVWVILNLNLLRDEEDNPLYFVCTFQNITRRKLALYELEKNRVLLDQSQQLAKIGGWEYDTETGTITWTDEVYRIYGVNPDEYDPNNLERDFRFYASEEQDTIRSAFLNLVEGGEPYDLELKFINALNEELWVRSIGESEIRDGEVVRVFGSIMDITEQKQAEEQRFLTQYCVDNAAIAIFRVDEPDARIKYVNNKACESLRYSAEELTNLTVFDIDPTFTLESWTAHREGIKKRGSQTVETVHRRKDGTEFPVEVTVTYFHYDSEEFSFSFVKDISERKRSEGKIRHLNRMYALLSQVNQAIVRADNRDDLLHTICEVGVDYGQFRMAWIGLIGEEGERIRPVAHAGHEQGFLDSVSMQLGEEGGSDSIIWRSVKDGKVRICRDVSSGTCLTQWRGEALKRDYRSSAVVPIQEKGEIKGILNLYASETNFFTREEHQLLQEIGADITYALDALRDREERKQAKEALRKSKEQLFQAQKMESIGQLAAGVAHDFNNLLTVIYGYSNVLLEDDELPGDYRNMVAKINTAGERASELTNQLLAFSRKQVIQPKLADLTDLVTGTEPMLRRLIGENIDLMVKSTSKEVPIKIDPGQMDQVLMNLASNASDAMPEGGQLLIETSILQVDETYAENHPFLEQQDYAVLSVSDTGIGMAEDIRTRVFEPFFTTKKSGEGTGLGLSTIYGIVKQNNGDVRVESESGKGTTFYIYLPLVEKERVEHQDGALPEQHPTGDETLLLVEDEDAVREFVRDILSKHGYHVLSADSPGECVETFQNHRDEIELIVTDVVMPDMNGRELFETLSEINPDLKVLYISGYPTAVISKHGVMDEEIQFIQKPIEIPDLLTSVRKILDL